MRPPPPPTPGLVLGATVLALAGVSVAAWWLAGLLDAVAAVAAEIARAVMS